MVRKLGLLIVCSVMGILLLSCSSTAKKTENPNISTATPETGAASKSTSKTVKESAAKDSPLRQFKLPGKKLVALTFDDGPNLETTPLVLDKLEKHGVVASFFLIGQNITESTKPVLERQLALGCEIGNHSWSHSYMDKFTTEKIKEEIEKTNNIIKEMTGETPAFFRPPYIAVNNDMYDVIDLPFICGIDCADWDGAVSADKRAKTILGKVKDGDIILLHDFSGNQNTVKALDAIIEGLQDDGFTLVTVSQLFEQKGVEPDAENELWTNAGQ